ncbi:hypothetical protein N7466_007893 [Penicillium verhagenii]|uniref:uncharacterized protein n=1 Tax=Penicillium verhagenii TaxID=1562060 RepID=UPI00254569EE|nr:uncharacterized protein N7466_007893 [Penicillium verhagenii]KAJ5928937.1 hypothetical protein N7466_007893 [Penicillium verhagenii]
MDNEALLCFDISRGKKTPKDLQLSGEISEENETFFEPSITTLFGKEVATVQDAVAVEVNKAYSEDTVFTDHETTIQDFLMEAIKFSSMTDREESVTVAHGKTFEWIFSDKPSPVSQRLQPKNYLSDWLRDGENQEGIYWISGKAGSGKSTLMRFVMQHAQTTSLLHSWARNEQLITAGFYFWISGTLEQRSQTGLLRHLLAQLLDQRRYLIPMVLPVRWKHLLSLSTRERVRASITWDLPELTAALKSFLDYAGVGGKVCLFIDGLDEFAGDHQQIVKFFKDCVSSYPHVKICLSSRPFSIFRAAFGTNPGIELHELTRRDMLQFAQDNLHGDPLINQVLTKDEETASKLIKDIVKAADGVFLWVILAVQSILRRENYQDALQIHQYLAQHPTDLDDLFAYFIFDSASDNQTLTASRLFQLIQARQEACYATRQEDAASMNLWEFALADQFEDIVDYIPEYVQQASEKDIITICEVTKARLSTKCAGLIVAHSSGSSIGMLRRSTPSPAQQLGYSKVAYVHRTVKDFISLSHVQSRLLEVMVGSNFDAHKSLLISVIFQFRWTLDEFYPNRQIDDRWPNIILAFTHARLSLNSQQSQLMLIPELDRALCQHWVSRQSTKHDHWARNLFSSYEKRKNLRFRDPFLSLSAKFGLATLVHDRVLKDETLLCGSDSEIPLLSHCIELLANRRKSVYPLSSPEIISEILTRGGDPNQTYQDLNGKARTPWLVVLEYLREADRRGWIKYYDTSENGTYRLAVIVSLFIQHGADPNGLLVETKLDPSASALEIITAIYRKYAAPEFGQLRKMLIDSGALQREGHGILYEVFYP